MKKTLAWLLTLFMVLTISSVTVFAADPVTVATEAELASALATGGEIVLADNVSAESVEISKDTTLDLAGKTLTAHVTVNGGADVTIKNGTVTVAGNEPEFNASVITVVDGELDDGNGGKTVIPSSLSLNGVTVHGGEAIDSRYYTHAVKYDATGGLTITGCTITGGTATRTAACASIGSNSSTANGLYMPNKSGGTVTISGSTITGGYGKTDAVWTGYVSQLFSPGGCGISLHGTTDVTISDSTVTGGGSNWYNAETAINVSNQFSGTLAVIDSTVTGGKAEGLAGNYGIGGVGVYTSMSTGCEEIVISGSTITGGAGGKSFNGSGIEYRNEDVKMTITDSTVAAGNGANASGNGAAIDIYDTATSLELDDVKLNGAGNGSNTAIKGSAKGITASGPVEIIGGSAKIEGGTWYSVTVSDAASINVTAGTIGSLEIEGDASDMTLGAGATVGSVSVGDKDYFVDSNGALKEANTITVCYTSTVNLDFWGEATSNSNESFVVELYEGDVKIASATLNNIDGIIDGNVYVTWHIPFAGSNDPYWTVEWTAGYPKYDMNPDKVVLVVDGVPSATNVVQYNGPDNTNKIVAAVGDSNGNLLGYYTSLGDAVAAGGNIVLLCDVTLTDALNIEDGATVVLDLNDKTINGYIAPCNPVSLAISNGSIVNTNSSYSAIETNAGTLTLTNVNIDSARHAVRIDGAVTATINGGEYKTVPSAPGITQHAFNISGAANVTIKSGTFTGPKGTTADSGSAVNAKADATVAIEGGNFSGGKNNTLSVAGTLSVTGGTFDQNPSVYVADGYAVVTNTDGTYSVVEAIAMIGDNYYGTIKDAVAALKANGETIKLIADINESITLNSPAAGAPTELIIDLNGFTVTSEESTLWVSDGYAVTVQDSSEAKTGEIISTNANGEAIAITRDGKVTLSGGHIYNPDYAVYLYTNGDNNTFIMNGGTIEVDDGGVALYVATGTATVNAGKVICNKTTGGWAGYAYYGTINVTGGEIFGTIGAYADQGGKANITGGTFTFVDGDTFIEETIAEGYMANKNANGTFTVALMPELPEPPEGFVWVRTYKELVAALAKENAKVIMANDITGKASLDSGYGMAGIIIDAGDLLDGNNYKLTITGANDTWDCAIAMRGGEVRNLTIAGAMRGIFMPGANGNAVIDNCVFEDVTYTFNSDAGSKDYTVTIKNTTLNGWTSYSDVHGSVTFENCEFGEGSGNAYLRPYQETTFINCNFDEGYVIETARVEKYGLTLNNCTYAGEEITTENSRVLFNNKGKVIIDGSDIDLDNFAQIGETRYETLGAAFEAAQNGDTIVLIADVNEAVTYAVDKTLTLDLNGYTITSDDADAVLTATAGKLTIVDSSADQTGAIIGAKAIHSSAYVAIQSGKFVGTITTKNGQADDSQVCITGGNFSVEPNAKIIKHTYIAVLAEDETYNVIPDEYEVIIIANGGEVSGAGFYMFGETVYLFAGNYPGYQFAGWVSDDVELTDRGNTLISFAMPDHAVTVTAYWATSGAPTPSVPVMTGTLYFETNGGSAINSITGVYGTKVDLTKYAPTLDGYTFAGWYSDKALTKPVTQITLSATKTVYAGWIKNVTPDIPVVTMPFTDVAADAYYYNAVLWAVNSGITTGMTDTMFGPDLACTRAQVVTFLWRAAGCPIANANDMPFADVSRDMYYHDAVLWAVEQGITNGISDTEFAPDAECSRAQIVTFLWRALGAPDAAADAGFVDVDADAYYATAVEWAVDNGITNGMGDNTFGADADCTRGQTVTFLFRFFCK